PDAGSERFRGARLAAARPRDRGSAIPPACRGYTRDVRGRGGGGGAASIHLSRGGAGLPAGPLIRFPSATLQGRFPPLAPAAAPVLACRPDLHAGRMDVTGASSDAEVVAR